MRTKFSCSTFWVIVLGASPLAYGQHDVCLPANIPASLLSCAFDVKPLTLVPLTSGQPYISQTDRTHTPYATYLYSNSNFMPAPHRASGEAIAAAIQPLNIKGEVDTANGKIVVVVEGISNTYHEFNTFINSFFEKNPAVNPKVEMINLAEPGCNLLCWLSKGVGSVDAQVQIVIMKHSNNTPQEADGAPRFPQGPFTTAASKRFPYHADTTRGMLKIRVLNLKKKYPNLKLLYLTSRCYGGWTCAPSANGYTEPVAFEEGFSTKWLIENQITGKDPELAFAGPNAKAPWMAWGPYIWDPTWTRDMFSDGVHPCTSGGQMIVARKWYDFLMQDSAARLWFRDNVAPTTPANLTTRVISASQINLSWNPATDNFGTIKYKIYRNGAFYQTTANTTYADAGLNPATLYCYTVSAIDSAGNESAKSAQACATTTTTGIADAASAPMEYKLFQNHPNPLRSETEIRFQLPEASQVRLSIFNIFAQEIRTLVEGQYNVGDYRALWDGKDKHGNIVASGAYLYQLRAGKFSQVKKMSLLR
jgi:hypothetical protein